MSAGLEPAAPRRIVVALETSRAGRTALDIAVRLAAALHAELEGVFVEDSELLELAALPFLREIRTHSLSEEAVSAERMQRDLRALARQAERMFVTATEALGVAVSFRVWRGPAAPETLADQLAGDIVGLARGGSPKTRHWTAAVTPAATGVATVHALLGDPAAVDRVLDVAARLADTLGAPLRVLAAGDGAGREVLRRTAAPWLDARPNRAELVEVDDLDDLSRALRAAGGTVLIADSADPLLRHAGLGACLNRLPCPVLMLR